MAILDENGLSGWVKRMLDLIFIGGICIFVSLPWSVTWYERLLPGESHENYWFLLVFLYFTGFFALIIVYELRRIFKTLNRHNPFMIDNVKNLQRMGLASFWVAAAYVVKIIFFNSFLTIILVMVFIIAGFFSIVLSEVFRQALQVKEENDLTI